jgi:hypothetical protein
MSFSRLIFGVDWTGAPVDPEAGVFALPSALTVTPEAPQFRLPDALNVAHPVFADLCLLK